MKSISLQVISSISNSTGGLQTFICGLCNSLATQNNNVTLLTGSDCPDEISFESLVNLKISKSDSLCRLSVTNFKFELQKILFHGSIHIIHLHTVWLPCAHYSAVIAKRHKVPLIISPHGVLEPWALNYKSWKKKLALRLYQRRDFQRADGFHATAWPEAENLRSLGIKKPIAIIPIGVDLPEWLGLGNMDPSKQKTALFLSRIHPKKGVLKLIEIWHELNPVNWRLILAGNDDGGHLQEVLDRIRNLENCKNVTYVGPVFGKAKEQLLREADLFVLPTYSENFGIVVPEALSYGIPVITTTGTPWRDLLDFDCGWYTEIDKSSFGAALEKALNTPIASLREKGRRGRALVEQKYQWQSVARDMNLYYLWISGRGGKPKFIIN